MADDVLVLAAATANLPGWYVVVLLAGAVAALGVLWWTRHG